MAQVIRIPGSPTAYAEAVDRYLGSAGWPRARAASTGLAHDLGLAAHRRAATGAPPPDVPLALLDDPGLPARLARSFTARAAGADADPVNRELSVLRAAISWWQSGAVRAQPWTPSATTWRAATRPPADVPREFDPVPEVTGSEPMKRTAAAGLGDGRMGAVAIPFGPSRAVVQPCTPVSGSFGPARWHQPVPTVATT
jgi:hypothetical protein